MPFTVKDWRDSPDPSTALSAANMENLEARLAAYSEAVSAGGIEIDSSEVTSTVTLTAPGSTATEIPGLTIDVPIGTRPVEIEFFCYYAQISVAARLAPVWLYNGTIHSRIGYIQADSANGGVIVCARRRLSPPTSLITYTIKSNIFGGLTGNVIFNADPGTADATGTPMYLRAIQV